MHTQNTPTPLQIALSEMTVRDVKRLTDACHAMRLAEENGCDGLFDMVIGDKRFGEHTFNELGELGELIQDFAKRWENEEAKRAA